MSKKRFPSPKLGPDCKIAIFKNKLYTIQTKPP